MMGGNIGVVLDNIRLSTGEVLYSVDQPESGLPISNEHGLCCLKKCNIQYIRTVTLSIIV